MITIISIIFCPDRNNLERFKNSINSILSADLTDVDKIIIDGWVSTDEMWKEVAEYNDKYPILSLNRRSENIGKSTIINENIPNTELVVYSDSDIIIFPDTIQKLKENTHKYDVIIPDQLEDCRHYKILLYQNKHDDGVYDIKNPEGIAGGFLMMKTDVIRNINFNNKGPYGSDDVEFFEKSILSYKIGLTKNIFVVHPFDDNQKYYDWKVEMSLSGFRKDLTPEDIQNRIVSSINFWK